MAEKYTSNIGKIFGEWKIIDLIRHGHRNRFMYICQHKFGKNKKVFCSSFSENDLKTCWCGSGNRKAVKDMIGEKIGRLTVIKRVENKNGFATYQCLCECGKISEVRGNALRFNRVRSCGCLAIEAKKELGRKRKIDISNQKFQKLLAIRPSKIGKNGLQYWEFQCDCGTTKDMIPFPIVRGMTKSCGCESRKSGPDSFHWNPNLSQEEREIDRHYTEYFQWKKTIYKKYNHTCQICGYFHKKGYRLVAHHLYSYAGHKELRTCPDNGIMLCVNCHNCYHKIYGRKDATKEKFVKFMVRSILTALINGKSNEK